MYACKDKPADALAKDPAPAFPAMDNSKENIFAKDIDDARQHLQELSSTSNHYCIVESDHPYRSASISSFRVEFPASVQWFTVEFDPQCGTAQVEDNLLISIPNHSTDSDHAKDDRFTMPNQKFSVNKNAIISTSVVAAGAVQSAARVTCPGSDFEQPVIVKTLNMSSQWPQAALILPGNRVDFKLETASHYSRDKYANKYGFRCLVVGYENPAAVSLKIQPLFWHDLCINICLIFLFRNSTRTRAYRVSSVS